ncbi:MAG: hypothetical protein M1824_005625 [Vezdaea acicularis]|nr:MAG: hypothetical protein M1824_005625 [Vezdaea acicularis]
MTSRRVPLSSIPNATNSPRRGAAAAASKRPRSFSSQQRDIPYGQGPPPKKQIVEFEQSLRSPTKQRAHLPSDGRALSRGVNNGGSATLLERKRLAAVERQAQSRTSRAEKTERENREHIIQWQKHYRSLFPEFVFYFESIPEEVRAKCSKQITSLGAREENFFSKDVTHVITTRSIPPEHEIVPSTDQAEPSSNATISQSQVGQVRTINPSLLERSSEATRLQDQTNPPKGKFTFEAPLSRRLQPLVGGDSRFVPDVDSRKAQSNNLDVLHRARALNMKIWALEKLQRMMHTMFDGETGTQAHGHNTRSNNGTAGAKDLLELLKKERLNGPSDRDLTVSSRDIVHFKGPFLYIYDMDEKTRPVMMREYPKVQSKEEGAWPMFRSVSMGKCPFLEDTGYIKRDMERELAKEREAMREHRERQAKAPRTRLAAATRSARMEPPTVTGKRALAQVDEDSQLTSIADSTRDPSLERAKIAPSRRGCLDTLSRPSQSAYESHAAPGHLYGGEPVASGVQPSNITSAIRSQMISSTAAAPGAKAGMSKEVHGLTRKVLEKNSGQGNGIPSSHRMFEPSGASREVGTTNTTRPEKQRGRDVLGNILEEAAPSAEADKENVTRQRYVKKSTLVLKKKEVKKRDLKPGYCENCREKFDDFEDHTYSRRHRKFATSPDNWAELDGLLKNLVRPLKETWP